MIGSGAYQAITGGRKVKKKPMMKGGKAAKMAKVPKIKEVWPAKKMRRKAGKSDMMMLKEKMA